MAYRLKQFRKKAHQQIAALLMLSLFSVLLIAPTDGVTGFSHPPFPAVIP